MFDMKKYHCECGKENEQGSIICEKCGRPIESLAESELLNMRYEGSARRSQTYNRTIIDKIWSFFSSVKVGIWLIAITTAASAIGTIFPQELFIPSNIDASAFYEREYGMVGKLYYELGFHNLYKSWWFTTLLGLIGISIIVASLDRFIPLYKALKKQGVTRHDSFMRRQRLFSQTNIETEQEDFDKVIKKLRSKRYNVRTEGNAILAEKNRFSRWGPYVNHIGLICILIGAMLRFFPGMYVDKFMWIREGETSVIKGTNGQYYLENEQFIFETYSGEEDERFKEAIDRAGVVPKNYQTNVVLYEQQGEKLPGEEPKLEKVKDYEIQVNKPLKFDSYAVYQVNFKQNEFKTLTFQLESRESGVSYGSFTIDLFEPSRHYKLEGNTGVELLRYFPDYIVVDNIPDTKSNIPNNPGFLFKLKSPNNEKGEVLALAILNDKLVIPPPFEGFFNDNDMTLRLTDYDLRYVSGLTIRKDHTLWIIALGGIIFMIGVIQGMYWHHRRIWIKRSEKEILLAGHTNKNYFGLQKEVEEVIKDTSINKPIDQSSSKS
jgi:cytochrome c biogenesis protein